MSINRSSQLICKGCGCPVYGGYLNALGAIWHAEHFVCAGCGRPIADASFQEHEGAPYHNTCYLNQVAPRCAYCSKPLMGQYLVSDGKTYHQECYRNNVAPRCAYCGKPLLGKYLIDHWGTKYCEEHQRQYPSCSFCGRLVPPQQQEHRPVGSQDVRCPICRSTAIETSEQAQPLFRKLIQWVNSQGLFYNNLHISLELCDRSRLSALLQSRAEPHSLGVTLSSSYSQNGYVLQTRVDGIAVLRGMPSTLFQGVTVHELGHAWLAAHDIRPLPLWAEEGFCELLSYRYCMNLDTQESRYHAHNIEQNPSPIYGDGFRRIRRLADTMGFQRFVETLRATKHLPSA
ncbi:MAG TPA: protein DA1 [Ktedonobacteraceae bacterium]|jgi:hypothetical protein|nr:protein DA1 [Ktedonobacteraceae bacterium]